MNNQQIVAIKMALDALERPNKISGYKNHLKEITALREALAQPQEPVANDDPYNGDDGYPFDEHFHAQLLAGAHLLKDKEQTRFIQGWNACREFMGKNTPPVVPQGKPVIEGYFFKQSNGVCVECNPEHKDEPDVFPLYTTPPSVEAVAGSDDDTDKAAELGWHLQSQINAAIEATKEKAAKVCEKFSEEREFDVGYVCKALAAAIRGMK